MPNGYYTPDEMIEKQMEYIEELKQQNADLLAALKKIDKQHKDRDWIEWSIVEQAIAKIEGKETGDDNRSS